MCDGTLQQIKYTKFIQIIPSDIRIHVLQNNIKPYTNARDKTTLVQQCTIQNSVLSSTSMLDSVNAIDSISTEINALQTSVDNLHCQKQSNNDS